MDSCRRTSCQRDRLARSVVARLTHPTSGKWAAPRQKGCLTAMPRIPRVVPPPEIRGKARATSRRRFRRQGRVASAVSTHCRPTERIDTRDSHFPDLLTSLQLDLLHWPPRLLPSRPSVRRPPLSKPLRLIILSVQLSTRL